MFRKNIALGLISILCAPGLMAQRATTPRTAPAAAPLAQTANVSPAVRRTFRPAQPEPIVFSALAFKIDFAAPKVDLRPVIEQKNLRVRSQGSRGTCSVFAMTFLLEYMYATRKNLNFRDLSEEYLNYASNIASGNMGDGDFFSNLDKGYRVWGAYPEQLVPYLPKFDPSYKVPAAYLAVGQKWARFQSEFIKAWNPNQGASPLQLVRALHALDQGLPVAAGLLWPSSGQFKTTKIHGRDVMRVPPRSGVFDGHSIVLVGYGKNVDFPGGGYFIFRNSWGKGWGSSGYGYMPFAYVLAYANDLFVYR